MAFSPFLTAYSCESVLLNLIEGLKLPNKPRMPYEIGCHGGIPWRRHHVLVCDDAPRRLSSFLLPPLPPLLVVQLTFVRFIITAPLRPKKHRG